MISWTRGWLVPWLAAPICCSSNAMLDHRSFVSGETLGLISVWHFYNCINLYPTKHGNPAEASKWAFQEPSVKCGKDKLTLFFYYYRSLVEALRDQYAWWCPSELRLDASADEFWHPSLLFVLLGPWRTGEMNYHLLLNFLIDSRWILHGSTIWPGGFSCSVDLIHIQ